MNSMSRPSTRKVPVSHFVQPQPSHYDEAPTPTISNCATPEKVPPPFSLARGAGATPNAGGGIFENVMTPPTFTTKNPEHNSSSNSLSSQKARFSSPTAEPIKMERPLLEDTPVSFSPRVASLRPSPRQKANNAHRSFSKNSKRRPTSLPQKRDHFSLALTIHDNLIANSVDAGEAAFWTSLIRNVLPFYLPVVCDLLKTGFPWNLLLRTVLAMWQRVGMGDATLKHTSAVEQLQPRSLFSADSTPRRNLSFSNAPHLREGQIQGIPNFGQTCFMNSVLQSLASLEPFLAYLERIHQVHQDRFMLTQVSSLSTTSNTQLPMSSPSGCFANQLLQVLLAVNGLDGSADHNQKNHNRLKIDPRPLLRRIGQDHSQFERKGEQQDAQEYLQALLGVVINQAHLDSITAVSDHMWFTGTSTRHVAEEPITAVLAGAEGQQGEEYSDSQDPSARSTQSSSTGSYTDSALSLSALVERIDENQKAIKLSPASKEAADAIGSRTASTSLEGSSSSHNRSSSESKKHLPLPEEKKQEDFEIAIPYCASEEFFEVLGRDLSPPISEVKRIQTDRTMSTVSESSRDNSQSQSKAMKIVQSTISSITPSPLSGWLGSTIQCCDCQHVRPIRNSPFLDVPLVPTSVPAYLARAHTKDPAPNSSPLPSCSIEQCLTDFTTVERVQDVECRFCTIRSEIVELAEEERMLSCAIESSERRIKAKGGDPLTKTNTLKEELTKIQVRLVKLQTTDPDEDDLQLADEKNSGEDEFLWEEDVSTKPRRLARCDARKCLFLTRCPSVLCCHIQRRYFDPYSNCMEKCVQHVRFEETLNLAPYCAYSPEASTSWVAGSARHSHRASAKKYREMLYRLESIIEHRGNAYGGHYVCYRRFGKSWFRISDNSVSHISWKEVRNCQAYMLFYEAM